MSLFFRRFAVTSAVMIALGAIPSVAFAQSTSGLDTPVTQPETPMPFSIGGNSIMQLTSGGLAIGSAFSPTRLLDVLTGNSGGSLPIFRSTSSANSWMTIQNATTGMNLGVGAITKAPYIYSASGNFFIGADGAPNLFINGMGVGGRVGILTSEPAATLDVNGSLNVAGTTTLAGTTTINATATVNGATTLNGTTTITGNTSITPANGFASLTVTGPLTAVGATLYNDVVIGQFFGYGGNLSLTSGSVTAYGYYLLSDANLKTDIRPIDHALDKLLEIKGVNFNWKKDGRADMGIIAQNVAEVFPDIVSKNKDGLMSVEYSNLIGPMIESIRELKSENDDLRQKISDMEDMKAQLSQIRADMNKMQSDKAEIHSIKDERYSAKERAQIVN